MSKGEERFSLLPVVMAAITVGVFAAVFAWEIFSFRRSVISWAVRDLETRTELAAANLKEALGAADFARLHEAGEICREQGLRLEVYSHAHGEGLIYDSLRTGEEEGERLYATHAAGDGEVRLGLSLGRVMAPFRHALVGFILAVFVGGAAVLFILLFTYRQHVRMRELARLERFRREFTADISHEIKTPLTGILGAVDLLMDDPAKEVREKLLGMVKKESVRLNALAQDVLSLSRLEQANVVLHKERVDLAALLKEAAERFRERAASVQMVIRVEARECFAYVDAQLMTRAIANLVENAIRYSKSSDLVLRVGASGNRVRLCVEDHGIGIAAEEAPRIFERFHRADSSRAAATGGAGLGLAIVRSIVQAHDGRVELERLSPSGCRFVLTFGVGRGEA